MLTPSKLLPYLSKAGIFAAATMSLSASATPGENPLFKDLFTADPATLVVDETVYLYVGHDEAKGKEMFTMKDWLCYSSKDMKTWEAHGPIMKATDFKWAVQDAWAAQVVKKGDKYYFYATVRHGAPHTGMSIGVAVSDSPTGPFVDARGSALIIDASTPSPYGWDDIDPTVLIDDDGTAWLAWGNPTCYLAKLKDNMTEIDGDIQRLALPNYTEGPWLSKRNDIYYLTYASFAHQGFSERICYATADTITGPWTYCGELTGQAKYSYTIHPAIVNDFHGQSYFFYHNADLTLPDGQSGAVGRRAVCMEYLYYHADGTINPIEQTREGVSQSPATPKAKPHTSAKTVQESTTELTSTRNYYPTEWTSRPNIATAANPFYDTPLCFSFSSNEGNRTIGQTFLQTENLTLGKIAIYGGDGAGTTPESPVTIALYDLGTTYYPENESYTANNNLLLTNGLKVTYTVTAPGELEITIPSESKIQLQKNHYYVIELQGAENTYPIFWRKSKTDIYPQGNAYANRELISDKSAQNTDFSLAIYGELIDGE